MVSASVAILALLLRPTKKFQAWGLEEVQRIEQIYRLPDSGLYAERYSPATGKSGPSFDWDVGVWMSALNAASKLEKYQAEEDQKYAKAVDAYWIDTPPVPGYDVVPHPPDADRYYDDNEWMVMSLCDGYEVVRDPLILRRAERTLRFVLSGEDSVLGGGIWWKEREKKSKNTCSNGPGAAACLAVFRFNKDPELLTQAEGIYEWTRAHLEDPSDHLFYDNVRLDGTVEKSKWSYNTALMIRAAVELFKVTKAERYKKEASAMVVSSLNHWFDPGLGVVRGPGRFAHLLLEAWIRAIKAECVSADVSENLEDAIFRSLTFVHDHCRDDQGLYGGDWTSAPDKSRPFELIDQASVARAFLVAATLN